eukprot:4637449-Amphidinium_carterae.1
MSFNVELAINTVLELAGGQGHFVTSDTTTMVEELEVASLTLGLVLGRDARLDAWIIGHLHNSKW